MNQQMRSEAEPGRANPTITYVKLVLVTLFWGATFVAGRVVSKEAEHFSIAFLRFAAASALLLPLVWRIEGGLPRLSGSQLISVVVLGMTGVFAYNALFFKGLQTIEAGRAALIIATCPVFITISSAVIFTDRIAPLKWVGVAMSVCGAITVISKGRPGMILEGGIGWGEACIFGCVVSWVAYSLIGKSVMKGLSPLVAVSYSAVVGTVALSVPALLKGVARNAPGYSGTAWLCIVYCAVFATVIGFVWYYEAIRSIGPVRAGLFINFVPIFGVVLGFLILSEEITWSLAAGGVLVVSGVYLTNRTRGARGA